MVILLILLPVVDEVRPRRFAMLLVLFIMVRRVLLRSYIVFLAQLIRVLIVFILNLTTLLFQVFCWTWVVAIHCILTDLPLMSKVLRSIQDVDSILSQSTSRGVVSLLLVVVFISSFANGWKQVLVVLFA